MRILNTDTVTIHRVIKDPPKVFYFTIRGKQFALDSNSLCLVELKENEKLTGLAQKPNIPRSLNKPGYLVLNLCHACNAACSYCYAQAYYPGTGMMTFGVAADAIRYFFPDQKALQTDNKISLGFFGGEPLLNWEVLQQCVQFFEELCKPRKPRFHVTTNGTLLSPERAQYLAQHNFSLIISLDGPEAIHNQCRIYKGGRGTFQDVMTGLANARSAGLGRRVTLRATYTPETAKTLVERARFLNSLRYDGYAGWVSIEPAFLTESLCVDPVKARQGVDSATVAQLEDEYLNVADWYVSEIRSGRVPAFHNITKFIERLLWRLHTLSECGAGVGYHSVNYAGDIGACHRESNSFLGNLYTGGVDECLRARWLDNRLYCREGCDECPVRYVCGGGCREESIGENHDIHKPVKVGCELKMIFFKTAVWILASLKREELMKIVPAPLAITKRAQSLK